VTLLPCLSNNARALNVRRRRKKKSRTARPCGSRRLWPGVTQSDACPVLIEQCPCIERREAQKRKAGDRVDRDDTIEVKKFDAEIQQARVRWALFIL
jgi:hypothetical protein